MTAQWNSLRKNIGVWHGAFVQFSPTGKQVSKTPSVLTLKESEPGQTMSLTLERFPQDAPKTVNQLTFTAPGPGTAISFFENGAFAQGASQWSSFGQFGTEVSLKIGSDRRVRFVVMYKSTQHYTSQIKYVTLICETQTGGTAFITKALEVEQMIGQWSGQATVIFADGQPPTKGSSQWQLSEDLTLSCHEQWENISHQMKTQGVQQGRLVRLAPFPESQSTEGQSTESQTPIKHQLDYQLMLLPNGAYCLLPQEIKKEQAFRIEVGWLSTTGEPFGESTPTRLRLIRYYDTRGVWTASTLITDRLMK